MLDALKSYFIHYRAERNATIVVAVFILLVLAGTHVYIAFYKPPPLKPEILALLQNLNDSLGNSPSGTGKPAEFLFEGESPTITYFKFNPNNLSDSGFTALGFSEREISTMRKYMSKGGGFKYKDDFAKLYFMDEDRFSVLGPYIDLPIKADATASAFAERKKGHYDEPRVKWSDTAKYEGFSYKELSVELNSADTSELKQLGGIGSYFAKSIVKYREKLGGYHSLSQLLEIKKITPETIDRIAPKVRIDLSVITLLRINRATAQELSEHPYVSFKTANALVNAREQKGRFDSIEEIQAAGLMDEELTRKLAPYLSFE